MDLSRVRHILHAIATSVVPESASLDDGAWVDFEAVISRALARRDRQTQNRVLLFLQVLERVPILLHGRPLTGLSARNRTRFLESVECSRFLLVRRGFWGIRTLVFMGYYTRDDVADAIGYHASPDGWEAHGGTVATVPLAPTLWVEP